MRHSQPAVQALSDAAGRRVIVSTGTKNLQDQIFEKDIPFLRQAAGMRFRAVRMKGRDNYLCRYRFEQFVAQPLLEVREEAAFLPVLRHWSRTTPTGDRAEVPGLPDGLRLWKDVNARADTCTPDGQCRCGTGAPCGPALHCVAGACVCDAVACPTGCCEGGVCRTDLSMSRCGSGPGTPCRACVAGLADRCGSDVYCRCGTAGSCTSTRARPSLCCMPRESSPASWSAFASRSTSASTSSTTASRRVAIL